MQRVILVSIVAISYLFMLSATQASHVSGWDNIRARLLDGERAEFVKPIDGLAPDEFNAGTEYQAVQQAASWVAGNMTYEVDEGEVWTDSNQQYYEVPRTGDCKDYAILLTALLRFHTQGGIAANRVWLAAGLVTFPGTDEVIGHAWVVYKPERGGTVCIEPQTGMGYHGNLVGEMIQFNDVWVKGEEYCPHNPNL